MEEQQMADKIQKRRDSSINWANVNPVLASGEDGYETDTRKTKTGDGSTPWNSLPYSSITSGELAAAVDGKVDATTTLAGYGITDAYTKTQSDTLLNAKVAVSSIVNTLTSTLTTAPLSAAQGKVLKDAIDQINIILNSDDTDLDTMQEQADKIKLIANGLESLGISNIVGLEEALASVDVSPITKPTITAPTNNTTDYIGSITTTYVTSESFEGVQDYVKWEAATDTEFATIVDSYEGSENLTSWTPNIGLALTNIYVRVKQGSDNHRSTYCDPIMFTTPDVYIQTPTLTVDGSPSDVGEMPTLTTDAFNVYNGSDTHASTDWQVLASDDSVVWESLADTANLLSVKTGALNTSTTYKFRARHNGATYGSSAWVEITATTKDTFSIPQGSKGFSVEPTSEAFAVLGLSELTGTNTVGDDEYGNYQHSNGSIVCWMPRMWYRIGHTDSPRYATYGANAVDMLQASAYVDEASANADGYVLHRVFVDGGSIKSGFFIDKYTASKSGSDAVSVKNGAPISLTTSTSYTNSNGMTVDCTGILADAVYLARARGTGWNVSSIFARGWLSLISIAQAQAATSTDDVAWYDATLTTNFPKGCNDGSLAKPLTGSGTPFGKTTHNGANNGVADVNGGIFEVDLGITNSGTSATDTAANSSDTVYLLKESFSLADLTGDFNNTNSAWGNSTNLANKYDLVAAPLPIGSSTGTVYWGNSANAVLDGSISGVGRDLCGFFPKDTNSVGASGTNQFGNDYFYKYNRANMFLLSCGNWSYAGNAGSFYRYLSVSRSLDNYNVGFRALAYV